jgi:hypothetical protein
MTETFGSLLSFGTKELFKFSRQVRTISGKLVGLEKSEMRWGGGGGRFTPLMAAAAAAFVRDKIRSEGEGLPGRGGHGTYPITEKWRKAKEKYAKQSDLPIGAHYATGALYESIKVLSRRARRSNRFATVGVSQKATVPHFGYGGYSESKKIKVATYAHNIEVGAGKPRPLIISAIIAFAEEVWHTGSKTLQKARDDYLKKNFSTIAIKETRYRDTVESDINKATKKMIRTLISECGFSRAAAVEMANAVKG